jgi:hypothetical protein
LASAILDEVRSGVAELETQCRDLGPLIEKRDWKRFALLLSDMGRARHAVMNAWEAALPERTAEFDAEIAARVRRVLEYREWQLRRLQRFYDDTGSRLQLISRWKAYARSVAGRRMRNPAVLNDIR